MADSFCHLHVHTEFSILDGASRLDELIAAAVADNQPALGITDHGNMYGVLDFYRRCKKAGIKPVIGVEAYMALESRHERPKRKGQVDDTGGEVDGGRKLYYHLTLLAENNTGYKNLIQVSSRAFMEGYYYRPRCDWETLSDHNEGLIATTGCLGGQVPQSLLLGNEAEALSKAARFQDIFGRDNYFIELQDHGIPEQRRIKPQLLEIARKLKAPLLATNDSHYTHRADAESHDALLCVQTGSQLTQTDRLKFHGDEHYLKTSAEMRSVFADLTDSCNNTLWIAERANVDIAFGKPLLPNFEVPEGFADDRSYLEHLTFEGARQRWGDPLPDEVTERLAYELQVICDMGFASYFLITWDLIKFARSAGIRVGPGRGSAAGCAVAYCLKITDLDPIRYDLLFERFLTPSRVSMPDIDMDFDSRRRDEVINYAAERYGKDRVAHIITFGRIKARAAVRDAARVLGYPASVGDRVAKAMPPVILGRDTPLRYCFEDSDSYHEGYVGAAELREMYEADSDVAKVVDTARGLEGLRRSDGIHAAAVVISPERLTDYLPIQQKPDSPVVTQYEMHDVEDLGLLKMDFLGLRNLDVISDTIELIKRTRGITVDVDNLPLDDSKTFAMLSEGDTTGVFQLESSQVRNLVRSLAPSRFDDVCALVALYRPGPMAANMHNDFADRKNGRSAVSYFHPDAEDLLADTYGLMIYQESVMRVAQRFAGYSLAEADSLRKAMGKKIRSAMAAEREKFLGGVAARGYPDDLGEQLFGTIEQFADYAFNKSHSYGYGLIAYQTAYLKANYPVEYFAALLTSVRNKLNSAAVYLNECRQRSIEVGVPCVNGSDSDFTPESSSDNRPGRILYGLSAVRHVGEGFVEKLISERAKNGIFRSFADFVERVDMQVLNKRTLESLIKGGAFDSLGEPRLGLLQVYSEIVDMTMRTRREYELGVMSLFGSNSVELKFDDRPTVPNVEFPRAELLAHEKQSLGLYLSDHPLNGLESRLRRRCSHSLAELRELLEAGEDPGFVTVGGVVTALNQRFTRNGDRMASFELEDQTGTMEAMVFPRAMVDLGASLQADAIVIVRARVNTREETARLFVNGVDVLDNSTSTADPIRIHIPPERQSSRFLTELKSLLDEHPGDSPVQLLLGANRVVHLSDSFLVDTSKGLVGEVRVLLGASAVA